MSKEKQTEARRDGIDPSNRTGYKVSVARHGQFVDVRMPLEDAFDKTLHPHSSGMKPKTVQTEEQHLQVFADEVKQIMTQQRIADAMKQLMQLARFVDHSESGLPALTRFTTRILAAYKELLQELFMAQQTLATTATATTATATTATTATAHTSAVVGLVATVLAVSASASLLDVVPHSKHSKHSRL